MGAARARPAPALERRPRRAARRRLSSDAALHGAAFRRYEANRKPRASQIQQNSGKNTWMQHNTNPDWVYGYDAVTAPLTDSTVDPAVKIAS